MLGAMRSHGRTVGKLLIAEPMLGDPNFDRSVVLMVDHTTEGALGVVLNRPTDLSVEDVLGAWSDLAARPGVLYLGGPVEQNGVPRPGPAADRAPAGRLVVRVVGDVGTIDLQLEPGRLAPELAGVRFFAGYSGWGGASSRASSTRGRGWSSTPGPTTCSPPTPR